MSVFLDDCSGDVDCVFFFDGGGSPNIWQSSVLPVGGVPPKSLFYLFVHGDNMPSIPLESVFALTPLISEGRFHIVKTPYPSSTSILLGFYVGILHCHSSPEVRFTLVTKDIAVDIVVDQLSNQGRTIQRISADSFSTLFSAPAPSSSSSSPNSAPSVVRSTSSSSVASSSLPIGVLAAPSTLLSASSPSPPSSIPPVIIPATIVSTPLKSPAPVQTDAELIQELSTTENFNKKTKKKIVSKVTNRKDLQIALITKLLESNNTERAAFICTQFGLQSIFPNLPQPTPAQQVPPPPTAKTPSPPATSTISKNPSPLHNVPPQPAQTHPPPQELVAVSPQLTLEIPQSQLPTLFPDDNNEPPSPSQPSIQELQQLQLLRRQVAQTPPLDPSLKASPKKKTPAKAAVAKPVATPKKSALDSSPNLQSEKTPSPNSTPAPNPNSTSTKVPKGLKTPTKPPPPPFSSSLAVVPTSTTTKPSPTLTLKPSTESHNLNHKNAAAIKAIYTRILSRIYPVPNTSEIRMEWDEPLEAALQCLAHMNVTEQHDDPEARFLVQLLLATMLESGITVAMRAQQGNPFSLHEHAVVVHETWKLLSHWGYSSDTLSMFEEIYMNNPEYFVFTKNKNAQLTAFPFTPPPVTEDFESESAVVDEQAWVEGWHARRIISNPSGE